MEKFIPSKCIYCNKEEKVMGENCKFYRCCFGYKCSLNDKRNINTNNIVKFAHIDSKECEWNDKR